MIERTEDGFNSRDQDTAAANDWRRAVPWEARVSAEAMLTRSYEEAAERSTARRSNLRPGTLPPTATSSG